jgi:hypothetical protein
VRLLWLPEVLEGAGLDVYREPGWQNRGRELDSVLGIVWHHTATGPNWQDGHVAALLRDGRRDLAGPLAQLGLERDGTFVVIAAGRANHNGYGTWGNQTVGIEAYNSGTGEPWSPVQLRAYHIGTAAILRHLRLGADRVRGHRETDPTRKIDPTGIDMAASRRLVAALLAAPKFPPTIEEDDMPTPQEIAAAVWGHPVHTPNGDRQPATLVMKDVMHHARLGAAPAPAAQVDTRAIAAAVVAALDPTTLARAIADAGVAEAVKRALREGTG